MIRGALALGLGMGALGAVVLAQGCGSPNDTGSGFPQTSDAGQDVPVVHDPDLEGGISGLLGAGCANARAQAQRTPVYMLLVLDGSGSMANANKWIAVTGALDAIFDQLRSVGDPAFGVGLTIFADKNDATIGDFTAGPYDKMDVPIAFVDGAQHNSLHARIDLTLPNLGTPTFEVLSGQFPLMEQFQAVAPLLPDGKKVLVFMTDGIPDPDMPAGQNEGPNSLKLVQREATSATPITTFAVGVGPLNGSQADYDPRFMGALAVAGGAPNQPCDPNETTDATKMCHFQITPGGKSADQLKQEFIATIDKIRTKVLSCEYKLDKTGGTIDPTRVNVIFTDGTGAQTILPENTGDGWTYDNPNDPSKVILHGATCDRVKADSRGKIEIVLGCKTILK